MTNEVNLHFFKIKLQKSIYVLENKVKFIMKYLPTLQLISSVQCITLYRIH